jgi:fructose-specific component phosphotransferase system IIB-like protein
MNKQATFFAAAVATLALAFSAAAQAAPQATVKFERVVITGKAVRAESEVIAQLPRVVVTGTAVRAEAQVVAQLPRVVINGMSEATLLRNVTLATAKSNAKRG